MFETLLKKKLTLILSPHICHKQHGFRPKMSISTITSVTYQPAILSALYNWIQFHSIYTDIKKGFSKVNHNLLISKLKLFTSSGQLLNWIKSCLSNLAQAVKLPFYLSTDFQLISGVPQRPMSTLVYSIYKWSTYYFWYQNSLIIICCGL